jgi:hypothetical protein
MMAIVGDRVAFAHLPKTGGTWVRRAIEEHDHGVYIGRSHGRLQDLVEHADGRTLAVACRDWSEWTASLHAHIMRSGGTVTARHVADAGGRDVATARALWCDSRRLARLDCPAALLEPGHPAQAAIRRSATHGYGLGMAWLLWVICDDDGAMLPHAMLRTSHLAADLGTLLGLDLSTRPPLNVAP